MQHGCFFELVSVKRMLGAVFAGYFCQFQAFLGHLKKCLKGKMEHESIGNFFLFVGNH